MRLAFVAGAAVLAAASFAGGPARAQATPGAAPPGTAAPSCGNLPAAAVLSVPAPFDALMRLMCRDPVGQGLVPAEGFRWNLRDGQPIGLVAMPAGGGPGSNGPPRFSMSWYTELSPVALSPAEQRSLKREFRRAIRPAFLDKATILELRARTSGNEAKLIFLVVPDAGARKPDWLIGLECNGTCFRQDTAPLMFSGSAG